MIIYSRLNLLSLKKAPCPYIEPFVSNYLSQNSWNLMFSSLSSGKKSFHSYSKKYYYNYSP